MDRLQMCFAVVRGGVNVKWNGLPVEQRACRAKIGGVKGSKRFGAVWSRRKVCVILRANGNHGSEDGSSEAERDGASKNLETTKISSASAPETEKSSTQSTEWQTALLSSSVVWQTSVLAIEFYLLGPSATPFLCALLILRHCARAVLLAALVAVRGAVIHSRLDSPTYRRLSLGLIASSQLMTSEYARCKDFLPRLVGRGGLATYYIQYIGVLMVWWTSLGSGVEALFKLPGILKRVLKSVTDFVFVPPRLLLSSTGFYALMLCVNLAASCFVGFGAVPSAVAAAFAGSEDLGLFLWRSLGREELGVVLASLYVLWDASQRNRLSATTFRHLNLAFCALYALRALTVIFFSKSLAPLGISIPALAIAFASLSGAFGYLLASNRSKKK